MNKQVSGIYWCDDQECIAKVFRIDSKSPWPYICGDLESTGDENPTSGDTFRCDASDLWDKEDCLEAISELEDKIKMLSEYIDLVKEKQTNG